MNEVAFRDANEKIHARRTELGLDHATPYLCECEEETCTKLIRLTASEYLHVRAEPRRFIVSPGHRHRGQVVDERAGYLVVEKTGTEGEIVEEAAE